MEPLEEAAHQRKIKQQALCCRKQGSLLLQLDLEMWMMICAFVGPCYTESLKRSSRQFRLLVSRLPRHARLFNPRYTEVEKSNLSLKFFRWANENGAKWDQSTCECVASAGHLGTLQWLQEIGASLDEYTCAYAAYGGHLNVVKWLVLESNAFPSMTLYGYLPEFWDALGFHGDAHQVKKKLLRHVCFHAAWGGHLDVLKWAVKEGAPLDNTCFEVAESEKVLQWLKTLNPRKLCLELTEK